jgi:hypothetical protein
MCSGIIMDFFHKMRRFMISNTINEYRTQNNVGLPFRIILTEFYECRQYSAAITSFTGVVVLYVADCDA